MWRLRRALYGLREAAARFQLYLESILVGMGFKVCPLEPILYFHPERGVRMLTHIDDPLIAAPDEASIKAVFDEIGQRVKVKEWHIVGGPTPYLGGIFQKGDDCYLERSKDGYLEGVLECAGMLDCKPVTTAGASRP